MKIDIPLAPNFVRCTECRNVVKRFGEHRCVQPTLNLTPRQRGLIELCATKAGISADEFLEELIQLTAERWLCRPGAAVAAMEKAREESKSLSQVNSSWL